MSRSCPFCDNPLPPTELSCPECGNSCPPAEKPANNEDFHVQLLELMKAGQKISAIKLYRERTGTGLAEAKAAVEALLVGKELPLSLPQGTLPGPEPLPPDLEEELLTALINKSKIEAIRIYREKTGAQLYDSKQVVDALERKHGLAKSRSGCLGMLFFFTLFSILTVALLV